MKRISINTALLVTFIPLMAGSILLILLMVKSASQQSLNRIAEDTLTRNIQWTQRYVDTLIAPAEAIGDFLPAQAHRYSATDFDDGTLIDTLLERIRYAPHLYSLYVGWPNGSFALVGWRPYRMRDGEPIWLYVKRISYGVEGRVAEEFWIHPNDPDYRENRLLPDDHYEPRQRPWYLQVANARRPEWTPPYIFFMTQKAGITYATPVFDVNDKLLGIAGVDMRLEALSTFLSENRFSPNSVSFVITTNGTVLSHPQLLEKLRRDEIPSIDTIDDPVLLEGLRRFRMASEVINGEAFFSTIETPEGPRNIVLRGIAGTRGGELIIGEHVPESDYLEDLRKANHRAFVSSTLVLLLALCVGAFLSRRLSRPITDLSRMANRVSQHDFSSLIDSSSNLEEIHQTISSFNGMIANLEEQRRENQELTDELRITIDAMPSILVAVSCDGVIQRWNSFAVMRTGIAADDAIGKQVDELLPYLKDLLPDITTVTCRDGESFQFLVEPDGLDQKSHLSIAAYPLGRLGSDTLQSIVVRVDDVSERVQMEAMMVETEKMISIGGMAAGLAHEINNPLSIISQASQNIARRMSPDFPANQEVSDDLQIDMQKIMTYMEQRNVPRSLRDIQDAVERTSKIIRNMLTFSASNQSKKELCNVESIIDSTLLLTANDYDLKRKHNYNHVRIHKKVEPDLPEIFVTKIEIEQVLFNLVKNACQAMSVFKQQPDFKPEISIEVTKDECWIKLAVSDNGPGIEPQKATSIFDPFFTTKAPGEGTGLGLSVSYFIITKRHKGRFSVKSQPSKGATFLIELPIDCRNNQREE